MENKNNKVLNYLKENKNDFILLLVYSLTIAMYSFMVRPFSQVHILKIPLDDKIPFVPSLGLTYNTYSLVSVGIGIFLYFKDRKNFRLYYLALIVSRIIGYTIFVFYSSDIAIIQPSIESLGDSFGEFVMYVTYSVDETYNGFPSFHTITMTIIILLMFYIKNIKIPYKIVISLYCMLIIATTVLVKQHVVVDIFGGIVVAIIAFYIAKYLIKVKTNKKKP